MSEFNQVFCVIPYRIFYLDGLHLSYLKVYEVLFQFWNHGKSCFLSNPSIMERTGLSKSTVKDALSFFEEKGEVHRIQKGRKRYLISEIQAIETDEAVDKIDENSLNSGHVAEIAAPTGHQLGHQGAEIAAHSNININNNNNKSLYNKNAQKNNTWANFFFTPSKNSPSSTAKCFNELKKTNPVNTSSIIPKWNGIAPTAKTPSPLLQSHLEKKKMNVKG